MGQAFDKDLVTDQVKVDAKLVAAMHKISVTQFQ